MAFRDLVLRNNDRTRHDTSDGEISDEHSSVEVFTIAGMDPLGTADGIVD
jgi:hypothetical protein